jgi:hypothetical protein
VRDGEPVSKKIRPNVAHDALGGKNLGLLDLCGGPGIGATVVGETGKEVNVALFEGFT